MSTHHLALRRSPFRLLGTVALTVVFSLGAIVPADAASRSGRTVSYRVKSGDTLRLIALRFYGSKRHWSRLYYANRAVLGPKTHLIYPGTVLQLPTMGPVSPSRPAKTMARVPTPPRLPVALPEPEPVAIALPVLPEPSRLDPVMSEPVPESLALEDASASVPASALPERSARLSPFLPAGASLLVPGSAQLWRGDWDRGLSHLGLTALSLGAFQMGRQGADPSLQWAGGLGLLGISLWSAWDAYREADAVTSP